MTTTEKERVISVVQLVHGWVLSRREIRQRRLDGPIVSRSRKVYTVMERSRYNAVR